MATAQSRYTHFLGAIYNNDGGGGAAAATSHVHPTISSCLKCRSATNKTIGGLPGIQHLSSICYIVRCEQSTYSWTKSIYVAVVVRLLSEVSPGGLILIKHCSEKAHSVRLSHPTTAQDLIYCIIIIIGNRFNLAESHLHTQQNGTKDK